MVSTATWDMKGGGKWQSIFCEWCETRRNDVILREFVCDGNWFVLISCLWFASSEMVQGPVKWHDNGICRGPYAGDVSGERKPWRHVMDQNANDGPNDTKQWSCLECLLVGRMRPNDSIRLSPSFPELLNVLLGSQRWTRWVSPAMDNSSVDSGK